MPEVDLWLCWLINALCGCCRTVADSLRSILEKQQRPDLLLCDFMVNACSDLAQTLDIPYAVTMSGLPNGGK
jgi:hypothetical protein